MRTRERQRLDTRNLILRVAIAEIAERGLARTRIEHIARKAGVTRPTFYAHFPSKEDVLRELQLRSERKALRELQRRVGDADGARFLHRLADALFDLVDGADPVLRREVFALVIREPREIDWARGALFGFVTARLGEAAERGEVPTGREPVELTRIVMTGLFGFLIVESEAPELRRRAAHRMLDLVIGEVGE